MKIEVKKFIESVTYNYITDEWERYFIWVFGIEVTLQETEVKGW